MTKGQRLKYFFWNLLGWYTIKKSDRIEAYEYSLRMFQRMSPPTKNIPIGLCKVLAFATKELNPKIRGYRYSGIVYANFPELYLQKPEPHDKGSAPQRNFLSLRRTRSALIGDCKSGQL